MQLFSTILPVRENLTAEALIDLVIQWNQNSPHADSVIKGITWNGERNIKFGTDTLWLSIEEYRNKNIIAIRYEKVDAQNAVWDTDFIMNFDEKKISICLERSYTKDATTTYQTFSTPYFINLLIDNGYVEEDNDLPITIQPIQIQKEHLDVLANVINKKTKHLLPVVYVSKTQADTDPVSVTKLAYQLRGVAHVLVQESLHLNPLIRSCCKDKNEFNGAIGIYYPDYPTTPTRYLYHSYLGSERDLSQKVIHAVMKYSTSVLIPPLYTWSGVNMALLQDRLSEQKAKRLSAEHAQGEAEKKVNEILTSLDKDKREIHEKAMAEAKAETDKVLDSFEEEISNYQKQIAFLTKQCEKLDGENQGLKEKLSQKEEEPLLYFGNEDEFYSGEIKDFILTVLNDSLKNMSEKSRKTHIVKDILQANDFQCLAQKREAKIRTLLKGYTKLSSKLEKELEALGFEISDAGKHYKLRYYGDNRYTITIAKTASDYRAGENNIANIMKLLF